MERATLITLVRAVESGNCPPEVFCDEAADAGVVRLAREVLSDASYRAYCRYAKANERRSRRGGGRTWAGDSLRCVRLWQRRERLGEATCRLMGVR